MEEPIAPHVLILPFPAEGHIKPMFNLAKLLSKHGSFKITFIHSHRNYARLHRFTDLPSFHSQNPNFHFASITDGSPPDHPRSGPSVLEVYSIQCRSMVAMEFRELFVGICRKTGRWRPPTCIIADGVMSTIVVDIGEEFKVPVIIFRTYSATCTWITFFLNKLRQDGIIPLQQGDMDKLMTQIPGLEHLLRGRDLPTICRPKLEHLALDFSIREASAMTRASSLILNTFDDLEAPIISKLTTMFPKTYTVGPLHALYKSHIGNNMSPINSNICHLRKEDTSCMTWLDSQKPKSVLYVSFGTMLELSRDQLLEFWHGFVNSGKKFLWVIREGLIVGEGHFSLSIPEELQKGTKEMGFVVDWAPQEEVLAHPAVGGFFTHSGWNSTLESIVEGVPMICWPLIVDQMVNSRCVSEQWRIGVDVKDTCDRLIVEKMVRDVMEDYREEIMKSTVEIARIARESIKENGSSHRNLKKLIEDIKSIDAVEESSQ